MSRVTGQATDYIDLLDQLRDIATSQSVATVAVSAGGTGYVVGDVVTASGGTSTHAATFEVTSVAAGVVDGIRRLSDGAYTTPPGNPVSTTGGTGTGLTLTLSFVSNGWTIERETQEAVSATVSAGGTGYSVNDQLTVVGGVEVDTAAVFNVDSVSGGAVTAVSLVTAGKYGEVPANPAATTVSPAGGSGATLTVTYQVESVTDKDLIIRGDGGGGDQIFVGIRTFNDSGGSGARNWELAGFTGHNASLEWQFQPGISPGRSALNEQGAYVPLNNATIDFWFYVNGSRIVGVFKIGTTYSNMYLGFVNRFGVTADFPYPLLVGGCSSQWNRLFSSGVIGYSGLTDPIQADGHTSGPFFLRDPGGSWKVVANSRQSGSGRSEQVSLVVWPAGQVNEADAGISETDKPYASIHVIDDVIPNDGNPGSPVANLEQTPNTGDDLTPVWPALLIEVTPAQQLHGELDNVFWVSAVGSVTNLVSEDTIEVGSDIYDVFKNCNRSEVFSHLAIKRE